jgi:predicted NodU family carbamoyl transferase
VPCANIQANEGEIIFSAKEERFLFIKTAAYALRETTSETPFT